MEILNGSKHIMAIHQQKYHALIVLIVFIFGINIGICGMALAKDATKQEQQTEIRNMAKETLTRLYKEQPAAKKNIETSAGYAVFSNFGMKIFLFGGGSGKGIVVAKAAQKDTFMKMIEGQVGFGMGVKKFRQVWVFKSKKALNGFINSGWEFGGQGTAAAKSGSQGGDLAGAISVNVDILLYQLTGDGLALELTGKGTKYYKDDDLN